MKTLNAIEQDALKHEEDKVAAAEKVYYAVQERILKLEEKIFRLEEDGHAQFTGELDRVKRALHYAKQEERKAAESLTMANWCLEGITHSLNRGDGHGEY